MKAAKRPKRTCATCGGVERTKGVNMSQSSPLPIDRELSRQLARRIRAVVGQCWHNARTALRRCSELAGGVYVEGWTVVGDSFVACEHGWCEANGVIVDPTYYAVDGVLAYFPALRFTADQVAKVRGYEPLIRQWYGWGKPETDESHAANERYIQAQDAALAYSTTHYRPHEK